MADGSHASPPCHLLPLPYTETHMTLVQSLHAALDHPEALWLLVSSLSSDYLLIVLLALYYWLVNPRGGRQLGLTFALSYLLNTVLKLSLNEPRPFFSDPGLASPAAKATALGPGLPSGHAQLSATLWFGAAWQLGRRWFWWLAGALVFLIGLSRLVLGVHFPSDVLVGWLLGAAAVAGLLRLRYPTAGPSWWAIPALAVAAAVFLPAYASGLGLLAGFWLTRSVFGAPRSWPARLGVALVGLVLVFATFLVFRLIPHDLRETGMVTALRYALTVLMATEWVPRLLRMWFTPAAAERPAGGQQPV